MGSPPHHSSIGLTSSRAHPSPPCPIASDSHTRTLTRQWNVVATTFGLIVLAELGDKTQLAAMGLASKHKAPWSVFMGASLALMAVTLVAVLLGARLENWIGTVWLKRISALAFLAIGAVLLRESFLKA